MNSLCREVDFHFYPLKFSLPKTERYFESAIRTSARALVRSVCFFNTVTSRLTARVDAKRGLSWALSLNEKEPESPRPGGVFTGGVVTGGVFLRGWMWSEGPHPAERAVTDAHVTDAVAPRGGLNSASEPEWAFPGSYQLRFLSFSAYSAFWAHLSFLHKST